MMFLVALFPQADTTLNMRTYRIDASCEGECRHKAMKEFMKEERGHDHPFILLAPLPEWAKRKEAAVEDRRNPGRRQTDYKELH